MSLEAHKLFLSFQTFVPILSLLLPDLWCRLQCNSHLQGLSTEYGHWGWEGHDTASITKGRLRKWQLSPYPDTAHVLSDGEILALLLYNLKKKKHSEEDSSGTYSHSQLHLKQRAERPPLHRPAVSGCKESNVGSFLRHKTRVRYNNHMHTTKIIHYLNHFFTIILGRRNTRQATS